MPANTAELHVAGLEVLVAGAALDAKWRNLVVEVRVRDTLALPSSAIVRITDPKGENVDSQPLQLGKDIEVKAGATGDRTTKTVFKGQVVAVEPEFGEHGCTIVARALDKGHKLMRQRKVRTFQQMSASDMVRKIAGENGLTAKVKSTPVVHEFFQQSAETEWDFLWRLARMNDYRVTVNDTTLNFGPFGDGATGPVTLKWQDNLISFKPRMSGVQQQQTVNVRSWDPKNKQVVTGSASSPQTTSKPGVQRAQVSNDLGGGTTMVADQLAETAGEANAIAKSALEGRADSYFEAEGVAFGNPAVKAGCKVKIDGVGQKFGGEFVVSSSTHVYKGTTGYRTTFTISGRSDRGLLDLLRPADKHDWSRDLVVGVVTNNKDPEDRCRVRVKFPSLSDSEESAWARVASVSAGNARGLVMLPQINEEVIVGFEHGDTRRPVVLGSLFNGRDKPGADLLQNHDGSFALLSNEKAHIHTKKDLEIKSDQKMIIEVQQDQNFKVQGNMNHETTGNGKLKAQQYTLEAGSTLSVKGVSVTVEASASLTLKGATVDVQASGPLNLKGAIINIG
jgi:phage protein D